VGGVGAYAADMICRAGVGEMTIVDADIINVTNINRQLPAMHSTLGQSKVEVMAQRLRDVNPDIKLHVLETYLTEEGVFPLLAAQKFDFVVDAIDTIAPKCALIMETLRRGIPIVSSMGAGAKSDITKIRFADLWETYHCGLAKAVRTRLKKAGVRQSLPVVFSTEQADRNAVVIVEGEQNKKSTAGTISYMPAVFGCYLAEYVIRKI
jgi:tRNA A37 threonylcarbamoyladenosine dehydratase